VFSAIWTVDISIPQVTDVGFRKQRAVIRKPKRKALDFSKYKKKPIVVVDSDYHAEGF
jgi:hypothetical protein